MKEKLGKAVRNYIKTTDMGLLLLAVAASAYGMLLISSAVKSTGSYGHLAVQGAAIFLGLCAFFVITLFDLEFLSFLWKWALFFNLVLLSLTLFFGTGMATTGNNSWIRFNLFGKQTGFQPGEVGKVIFIFTLAKHFKALGPDINRLKGIVQLLLHAGVTIAFVYVFSKDDGMAVSYLFIFIIMAFAAGIYLRYCFAGLLAIGASVPILWNFVMQQYQRDRFIVLFDASYKLDGVGYHQMQSKKAIANGGFWGQGLFDGTITQYGHLPAKETDFIFSVACEELGFFGGFLIIALLTAIIIKCVFAAISVRDDRFSMLVCLGVAAMLTFQTFINIGMNLGLAPVVGLTLPFMSSGGTSIVTMFAAVGVVASIKRHHVKRSYSPALYSDD